MKTLFFISMMVFAQTSLAQIDRKGNGGDICEDRFKIIRDDIQSWINDGGAASLDLPEGTSLIQYSTSMLDKISKAQISCTDSKVIVANVEKTCENFSDAQGILQIVCNNDRFMSTSDENQYVLVHHEYAGLSGLEVNVGPSSQYVISNQITASLQDQVVKKLVVKKDLRHTSESGLVQYDHIVELRSGFYQVMAPSIKGVDGKFYPLAATTLDIKDEIPNKKTSELFKAADVICQALGFNKDPYHPEVIVPASESELVVDKLFGTPKPQDSKAVTPMQKVSILKCQSISMTICYHQIFPSIDPNGGYEVVDKTGIWKVVPLNMDVDQVLNEAVKTKTEICIQGAWINPNYFVYSARIHPPDQKN